MTTAYLTHPDCMLHVNPGSHPERPARLEAIEQAIDRHSLRDRLIALPITACTEEQLLSCHAQEHVAFIKSLADRGGAGINADTYVGSRSYDVAKLAAGGGINAVDAIAAGEIDNAFVAVRPCGHHAESNRAMGFCLFNNVAIVARHAQRRHGWKHIAILDWDVHHGNGTQEIFYRDPSVFFASVHQSPWYPYFSGAANETGEGAGQGTNLNFPLPAGCGDAEYLEVWEHIGQAVHDYRPDLIIVSAGFDAHRADPLGGMTVTEQGFAKMARMTKQWAHELCENRLVCVLEGGYDLNGLGESAAAVMGTLLEV